MKGYYISLACLRRQSGLLQMRRPAIDWRIPVLLDTAALLVGMSIMCTGPGLRANDPVYSLVVPYYGFFNAVMTGIMCMTAGLAMRRTEAPIASLSRTFLYGVPLLAAFVLHLANAGAFRCAEVSVVACAMSFLTRCGDIMTVAARAAAIVLSVGALARVVFSGWPSVRTADGGAYVKNVICLMSVLAVLGLLAYEALVLWCLYSLSWYVPTVS